MKLLNLAVVVLVIVSFASCTNKDKNTQLYTGEELFRGIFFCEGNIPSQISSFAIIKGYLDTLNQAKKTEYTNFTNKITSAVKNLSPNYFNNLLEAIKSKDNYAIDESLNTGAKLLQVALATSIEYSYFLNIPDTALATIDFKPYDLSKQSDLNNLVSLLAGKMKSLPQITNPNNKICLAIAVVVALVVWEAAAIVNVAAIATVYAAVYAKVCFWGSSLRGTTDISSGVSFQRELIIKNISNLNLVKP
jgi:hypothetical protein